jgi:hypothetical protein
MPTFKRKHEISCIHIGLSRGHGVKLLVVVFGISLCLDKHLQLQQCLHDLFLKEHFSSEASLELAKTF